MATISNSTFNPLSTYVNVRIQQGVPIVDADVNELDDIRKFELRAFLKWFVGDGVPEGNDGFRISGGLSNDFTIIAGVPAATAGTNPADIALRHAGRFIVDGLDVMIGADQLFSKQPLHESMPGAAALAAARGVPVIRTLTTPAADGRFCVYLDLWERLVTADEVPGLIHPGLGVESCARTARDWAVRVRSGIGPPAAGDPDFLAGHAYSSLALVQRRANDPMLLPGDFTDQRNRRLIVPPATLVEDVLGTDPDDYRAGRGRPPISLRAAINALLRGELPSTPDRAIDLSPANDTLRRSFLFDPSGGLTAIWQTTRINDTEQAFGARLSFDDIPAGFSTPQAITAGIAHVGPHAALLPNGDLLVAYQNTALATTADIAMKRGTLGTLATAAEIPVAATAGIGELTPFVTVAGSLATIFYLQGSTNRWQYRRWNHTTSAWADNAGVLLSAKDTNFRDLHAAVDRTGAVWVAFRSGGDIQALQFNPVSAAVANEITHDTGGTDSSPFVLCTRSNGVWMFWESTATGANPGGIALRRFVNGTWTTSQQIPGTSPADHQPCAVEDADGGVWLIWSRGNLSAQDIFAMRCDPSTGNWGTARQLTVSPNEDSAPYALLAPDTSIWVFWSSDRDTNVNIYYKRVITAV